MDTLVSILEWLDIGDKGDDVDNRILRHYLKRYGWMGFWPETTEKMTSIRYLYPRFLFSASLIAVIWTFVRLIATPHSTESLSEHLSIMAYFVAAIIKLYSYIFYPKRLKEICAGLEVLQNRHADEASRHLLKTAKLASKFISNYVITFLMWCTSLMATAGWCIHMYWKKPLFITWSFCEMNKYPCFLLNLSLDTGAMLITYNSIAMCDSFLIDLLVQTLYEYKILNHNLFHIKEHVIKKLYGYNQPVIRRGLALQARRVLPVLGDEVRVEMEVDQETPGGHRGQCPLSEVNEMRCLGRDDEVVLRMTSRRRTHLTSRTIRKECGLARRGKEGGRLARRINEEGRRTGRIIEERIMAKRVKEGGRLARRVKEEGKVTRSLILERDMEAQLENYVKHHQDLIRFTNAIGSFYSTHLLTQVIFILTSTTTLVLYCTVITSVGIKELCMALTALLSIMELFLFCWFSNQITQESSNVRDSVYGCDWLETSESFKRSMRVIMSRSNDPVVIKGGGFVPISIETFYAVTKSAYSYYMALRTINENNTTN